ncbi:MAG: Rpn family recombination-promoting nuclease/putative transposase [Synergistes sp.]|nr:Rpn family recombination-promoting nuclease/putative transposase [Synergistes sp.]
MSYDNENTTKSIENITITNSIMFALVMSNPANCKEMIERILGIKIVKLKIAESEKSITLNPFTKGTRLDIYAEDDEGTAYDIEMQAYTSTSDILAKRSRAYLSRLDGMREALPKGEDYGKLRKSYIIFVCSYDPFGLGLAKYEFATFCTENKDLELKDGARRIFLNAKGDTKTLSDELANLLKYIGGEEPSDEYTENLNTEVIKYRTDEGMGDALMTIEGLIKDASRISEAEGEARGRKEGIGIGRAEGIGIGELSAFCRMVKSGIISVKQAAESMNISVGEFRQRAGALL